MLANIDNGKINLPLKGDARFVKLNFGLEGRRGWKDNRTIFWCEDTGLNRSVIKNVISETLFSDEEKTVFEENAKSVWDEFDLPETKSTKTGRGERLRTLELPQYPDWSQNPSLTNLVANYLGKFKTEPYEFQKHAFSRLAPLNMAAYFAEQGTGKTKMATDKVCYDFETKGITGVLVLAKTAAIAGQWVSEHLPKHMWDSVSYIALHWKGTRAPEEFRYPPRYPLEFFCANIDALRSKKGLEAIKDFLKRHRIHMIIVDESDTIKNHLSQRSKTLLDISSKAAVRVIMTGTPIAKDLCDEWAQFLFLDEKIIGIRYKTAFKSQFCITVDVSTPEDRKKGKQKEMVVGHKNIEQFNSRVSPYIFRATKAEELDLPPKVYDELDFDLTPEQKELIKQIKETHRAEVNAKKISIVNAAAIVTKLQQIGSGFVIDTDGETQWLSKNPRLDAFLDSYERMPGKKIAWCRFTNDIEVIKNAIGNDAVCYYGKTGRQEREDAIRDFIEGDAKLFIANAASAGTGIDGLQKVCSRVFYYTNSFNAIDRWQSEDRTHRIGMGDTCRYFDMIGIGGVDRIFLGNLMKKKGFSEFVLDGLKDFFNA